jgi:hypothetical protein
MAGTGGWSARCVCAAVVASVPAVGVDDVDRGAGDAGDVGRSPGVVQAVRQSMTTAARRPRAPQPPVLTMAPSSHRRSVTLPK